MTADAPRTAEVGPEARIVGLDLARALAIFGMVAVNYRVVMDPDFSEVEPDGLRAVFDAVTGRAAALFVLLAGIGVTLLGRRPAPVAPEAARATVPRRIALTATLALCAAFAAFHAWSHTVDGRLERDRAGGPPVGAFFERALRGEGVVSLRTFDLACVVVLIGCALIAFEHRLRDGRGRVLRRGLLLLAFGYAWYPLWTGDILHVYGVFLILGAALVRAPAWVTAVAAALAVAGAALWQFHHAFLQGWQVVLLEDLSFWTWTGLWRNLLFNGWNPVFPWFAFFAAGLLAGRLDLRAARTAVAFAIGGALVAAAALLAADAARDAARAAEREAVDAAFPVAVVAAEGLEETPGPVLEDDGTPARPRSRLSLRADPALIRERPELGEALKLLAARLRALRDRAPYPEMRLALVREVGAAVTVISLAHDPGVPLPEDAEATFVRTRDELLAWMAGRGGGLFAARVEGVFGDAPWPPALDRVALERLSPVRGEKSGEVAADRLAVTRRARIDAERIDEAGRTARRLKRQTGTDSWPHPNPFFVLSAGGIAFAILGVCLLLTRLGRLARVLRPLVLTGRMALTVYVAHVVIGLGVLDLIGKTAGEDLRFIAFYVGVCWLAAVAASTAWLAFFRQGPLEALLRRLSS